MFKVLNMVFCSLKFVELNKSQSTETIDAFQNKTGSEFWKT